MMQRNLHCSHGLLAAMFAAVALFMFSGNAFAAHVVEKVIYSFLTNPNDGWEPGGGLVADPAGNLYGSTTVSGSGLGTIYELTPPSTQGGAWSETILYVFQGGADGNNALDLVFDKLGNLYSTTEGGGLNGQGTVFELSPPRYRVEHGRKPCSLPSPPMAVKEVGRWAS